jgi:hypothetical protein
MSSPPRNPHVCWICDKELCPKDARTDDRGSSVHEECYVTLVRFREGQSTKARDKMTLRRLHVLPPHRKG